MKGFIRRVLLFLGLAVMMAFVTMPAIAGESSNPNIPAVESNTPGAPGDIGPDTYGTTDHVYKWIPSAQFTPRTSTLTYSEDGMGYYYRTGGGTTYPAYDFSAPVDLPAGALLNGARLYYCDSDATNDITMWFTRYYGDTLPAYEDIEQTTPSGTPGCTSVLMTIGTGYTIDNYSNSYAVVLRMLSTTSALKFKGVRLYYDLQISPAPATATFSDVPVGSLWHRYVEALYDAGITSGYGNGTFGPNDNVTRGQMAAFLARALGLHW